jgi:hypothetical protein
MATVVTSIGSNASIDTETPSSCSGSSSPYSVTFSTAPTGVSVGDKVEITDDATYYATFTYRVTAIAGTSYTLAYVTDSSGNYDTSPCDLMDGSFSQAPATFKRFYSSIVNWEAGLDDSDVYASSDDAVGECHNDSVFAETVNINGGGTVGLASIKLSVHSGSRHDGTAGTGARMVPAGAVADGIATISVSNCTIEWLEISAALATSGGKYGVSILSGATTAVYVRNNIIHDITASGAISAGVNISSTGTSRYVLNNFIYNVESSSATSLAVKGIRAGTSGSGADIFCNTIFNITTTAGAANGIDVGDSSVLVKDNIVLSVSGTTQSDCFYTTATASASSDYNLSDDATAWGSNSVTSADGATAANTITNTTSGSEDLHLKSGSYALQAGTDLGTTPTGVEIDIDGRNRDTEGDAWDIGADQTVATGVTITPAAAAFELAGVSPTTIGSVSITPTAASFELAAVSPTVVVPTSVATVVTSIGSNASIDTETPSSCSGSSSPYSVTFSTTPTGVNIGDKVEITDEATYYATFTYRVTAIAGTSYTLAYVTDSGGSNDTSPCDLMDGSYSQAPATFKRFYSSITNWEAGLDDSDLYQSSDDAVGECHNDSIFRESVTINGGGTVGLASIKLSVHSGSRHDGTAGTGARMQPWSTPYATGIVNIACDNVTVEWLEINGESATDEYDYAMWGINVLSGADQNIYIRNNIIHDMHPELGQTFGIRLVSGRTSCYVMNNFIYNIIDPNVNPNAGSTGGIVGARAGDEIYCNTVFNLSSEAPVSSWGISISDSSAIVSNNICLDVVSGGSNYGCFGPGTITASAASDYNLGTDDYTVWGDNSLTDLDGVTAANTIVDTTSGSEDLHLKSGSYAIDAGEDLGTTPSGVEIDIDGRNRHTAGDTWDIGADETVVSISLTPSSAAFELAGVSPSVGQSSLTITVALAAFVLTGVTPTVVFGNTTTLPTAARFELSAITPAIIVGSLTSSPAAASFELAGISPTIATGSIIASPAAAAFEIAGVSPAVAIIDPPIATAAAAFELASITPTVVAGSVSITPSVAAVELAGISPSVAMGSVSIAPAVAAFELAGIAPTVQTSSVSVTPAAAAFDLAAVDPSVVASSMALTPSVAVVEFAGISPSASLSSVSITPTVAAVEFAGVSPAVQMSSSSVTPAVAAFELAGIVPTTILGSIGITPTASAVELAGINPSITAGSLSVSPAASVVELAGISPTTLAGNLSITPTVAALEFAGISPSVTYGNVGITPAPAVTIYSARLGGIIAGNITVVPNPQALFVYTAADPAVGMSSQTIAVSAAAFEVAGVTPSTTNGSLSITPAVSVVELAASLATIHAGVEVTPAVAAFEYVVGSFALIITMDSASLGYSCDGVLDYIGGVLPTDYNIEKGLDYKYDHQS